MKLLLIFVTFLGATQLFAADIYFGSEAETIRVKYGGPTIFRFPTDVRTISQASRFEIVPANESDPDYSVLAVTPRFSSGTTDVVFMLGDGSVVRAKVVVMAGGRKIDGLYDFKPKSDLVDEVKRSDSAPPISALELLKAMVRDDLVNGYKRMELMHPVSSGAKGVRAYLVRAYRGPDFSGFVFKIENLMRSKTYDIDVRRLEMGSPNLAILSQTDRSQLNPHKKEGSKTYLRIVAKTTGESSDIRLPIAVKKGEKQ